MFNQAQRQVTNEVMYILGHVIDLIPDQILQGREGHRRKPLAETALTNYRQHMEVL
jgi:hypothetical protein